MILAIESSCDETSVALFKCSKVLDRTLDIHESYLGQLIKSQVDLHSLYGGVVPELAARQHSEALPQMVTALLEKYKVSYQQLKYIAVTSGPGLKGCLIVGLSFAKGLSEVLNIPLIPINHLEGHILSYAIEYPSRDSFPALCLLVSGGHSEIILVNDVGRYEILCETSDDAAGEAFDKVGTLLGIKYPAGRELSIMAEQCSESDLTFPEAVQRDFSTFSFSGLKTAVKREVEGYRIKYGTLTDSYKASVSFAVQDAIVGALLSKLNYWIIKHKPSKVFLAGGVASNSLLRGRVEIICKANNVSAIKPSHEFCTDNAAMIGAAALMKLRHRADNHGEVNNDIFLTGRSASANPRWSIEQDNG